MNTHHILFASLALLVAASSHAETLEETLLNDSTTTFGVMRVAPLPAAAKSKAPKGYEPVYISHYGRHGARRATSDRDYNFVRDKLTQAHADGRLTPWGESIYYHYVNEDYPRLAGDPGELTPLGHDQHRGIAAEMAAAYPKVFKNGTRVGAESSIVTRCVQSMAAFCCELQKHYPHLNIQLQASPSHMAHLSPCDQNNPAMTQADKELTKGVTSWRLDLEKYAQQIVDTRRFVNKLFTDTLYAQTQMEPLHLSKALFAVYSGRGCLDFDMTTPFDTLFTAEERAAQWEIGNVQFYMMEGPGLNQYPRLNRYASALMSDIITKADADMASGEYAARLRFGHDMTIMGLLSYLNIDTWGTKVNSMSDIKTTWHNFRIPMGSNLQFVFYRNKHTSTTLFRMLLNGEALKLPIASYSEGDGTYYNWADFTAYCHRLVLHADR
jgi:hypothetical protein